MSVFSHGRLRLYLLKLLAEGVALDSALRVITSPTFDPRVQEQIASGALTDIPDELGG